MNTKLAVGVLALALLAVFVIGAQIDRAIIHSWPEVRAAIAEQERAKAESLKAQAAEARARANAATEAQSSIVYFWRWSFIGAGAAIALLLVGGAWAAVTWARAQARLIYPRAGQWPLYVHTLRGGETVITDPARALGNVTTIGPAGQIETHFAGSEAAALQLATQAQASGVMIGVASKAHGDDVVKRVSKASESLPAPSFATGPGAPGLRMVYVKQGNGTSEAQRDLQDLREFITGASVRGLARRSWMGFHFASGHECTRARYDELIQHCEKAGVIKHEGQTWVLSVSEAEALDAFGIGAKDEADV